MAGRVGKKDPARKKKFAPAKHPRDTKTGKFKK